MDVNTLPYDADTQNYNASYLCFEYVPKIHNIRPHNDYDDTSRRLTCTVDLIDNETLVDKKIKFLRSFILGIVNENQFKEAVTDYKSRKPDSKFVAFVANIFVPLEKARQLKDKNISTLVVGRVADTKLISRQLTDKPSITNDGFTTYTISLGIPFEVHKVIYFEVHKVIYYVIETGEILGSVDIKPK